MIKLEGIEKAYGGGSHLVMALDGVNLEISREEYIAVMGPSGSGKSTLLHIIGALDLPTAGNYFLEDIGVHLLSDRELARIRNEHFGFVFQSYNLFPELTALENVLMPHIIGGGGLKEKRQEARELLELVDMSHRANHYPSQLSGGEQQRVAIARALI
ncbi:MAG: ABC transporter ATP-binding protein, partial [Fibrobacter sp.]|nr:ABC transporter ATP-binding protein [Fibrobacter sp.]